MTGRVFISVDIEADGPIPGVYSMVSFGAVVIRSGFEHTFYGQVRPISEKWIPDALAVSGHSREETMEFEDPTKVMQRFADWIELRQIAAKANRDRAVMVSDNAGFDFGFMSYYLHRYVGSNPFGWSCIDARDLWRGMNKDMRQRLGKLRKTKHTHHPVDDAKGNAEAFLKMIERGLHVPHMV